MREYPMEYMEQLKSEETREEIRGVVTKIKAVPGSKGEHRIYPRALEDETSGWGLLNIDNFCKGYNIAVNWW